MKRIVTRRKLSTLAFALAVLLLRNTPAMAQVSAYQRHDGVNAVVFRGTADSHIWEYSMAPGNYWQRNDLFMGPCGKFPYVVYPVAADSAPMGYVRADKVNAVVYAGADHYIHEQSLGSGHWCPDNLSTHQNPAAPPAAPSAKPWGYITYENTSAVVYRGSDGHIYQIERTSPGWQWSDLFHNQPATPAATDPIGYVTVDYHDAAVFIGTDQHVHQRERTIVDGVDIVWAETDLTQSARTYNPSVPLAAPGTKPTAFVNSQGSNVAYTGTDGHIHLLMQADSQAWYPLDLTPNAPQESLACSSPFEYRRSDNYYDIVYAGCSTGSYIYELASMDGISWACYNLDAAAGGGAWANGDPVAYVRSDYYNSVVYPEAFDTYIDELTYYSGGYWQFWSLTYR
jgi:hypothetical protein